jgi:hypothetical protein
MLWSKPTILYDTILDYRIENYTSLTKFWKIKHDSTVSAVRVGRKICLATVPQNLSQTSILWQHLFLDPLLKDVQSGWHLCLLPRHMVVVIKDGLYICEGLVSQKEEQIESTKTYLYRFGYEPDMPIQIHDWQKAAEAVTIPAHYTGFVLEPYHPWYKHVQNIGVTFFRLLAPHTISLLCSILLSLSMGSLYYGYQNYTHDQDRIRMLQAWPAIQSSKARTKKLLQLVGLLDEAKAPTSLIQKIDMNNKAISILCSDVFSPDKNLETMKKFLKKYYPYPVTVKSLHDKNMRLLSTD